MQNILNLWWCKLKGLRKPSMQCNLNSTGFSPKLTDRKLVCSQILHLFLSAVDCLCMGGTLGIISLREYRISQSNSLSNIVFLSWCACCVCGGLESSKPTSHIVHYMIVGICYSEPSNEQTSAVQSSIGSICISGIQCAPSCAVATPLWKKTGSISCVVFTTSCRSYFSIFCGRATWTYVLGSHNLLMLVSFSSYT